MVKSCWQCFLIVFVFLFLSSYAIGGAWLGTKFEMDSDGDGDIDNINYNIYDADATWIESRYDNDADGKIDSISYYTYNINGYNHIIEHDLDANGSIDSIIYSSQLDNGKISITEDDNDADGTIDTFAYYTFDDVNLPTIMKYYKGSGAYDSSATLVSIHYYTYDANCNQIQDEDDKDADGQIDEITYNTYDEQCRLSIVKTDTDNDGDFESVLQNSYDDGGLICRTEISTEMTSYGFTVTSNYIYDFTNTYDENGYATKIETHFYGSENINGQTVEVDSLIISYTTWEYFENVEGNDENPYASECGCSTSGDENDENDLVISMESQGNTGIVPFNAQFFCTVASGNPPYEYQWDFGDSSANSINENPSHTYENPGCYTVICTVTDASGQQTVSQSVTIKLNDHFIVLTDNSPDCVVYSGNEITIYGTSGSNEITIEKGADANLMNTLGSNKIIVEGESDQFEVSRSGATLRFQNNQDGTYLKIPATLTSQTIQFNDGTKTFLIENGHIMLGGIFIE